jgi:hypothetical protein
MQTATATCNCNMCIKKKPKTLPFKFQMAQKLVVFIEIIVVMFGIHSIMLVAASTSSAEGWTLYHNRVTMGRRAVNECENSVWKYILNAMCTRYLKVKRVYLV